MTAEKIFANRFNAEKITDLRLANFADDCLSRFTNTAIEGQFATIISELTIALGNMRTELNKVDNAVNSRKVKTFDVNEFIKTFKHSMSELEGAIAYGAGGFNSAPFKEMYPNGVSEYSKATKKTMPSLVGRIKTVVTKYPTAFTEELTTKLNGFYTQWNTLHGQQETSKSKTTNSRETRSEAREQMELALYNAIASVMLEFPMDVEKCARFFDFNMLYPVKHHEEEEETVGETEAAQ